MPPDRLRAARREAAARERRQRVRQTLERLRDHPLLGPVRLIYRSLLRRR